MMRSSTEVLMTWILRNGGRRLFVLSLSALLVTVPASVSGQEWLPAANAAAVSGGLDVTDQYIFRGVRQNSTGVVASPHLAFAVRMLSDAGALERLTVDVGFWNSVNSGDTGSAGPTGRAWYESRLSAGLNLDFGGGISLATSYTTYVSPNELFTTAKELGVRVAVDDRRWLGRVAVRPYALVAVEVDAQPGVGQLDGGLRAGRYLELGATPGFSIKRASVTIPTKVGLSLRDYYELGDTDSRFGFASVGGVVSIPISPLSKAGQWHVRGGIEFYRLGGTTSVFNGNDRFQTTASIGVAIRP